MAASERVVNVPVSDWNTLQGDGWLQTTEVPLYNCIGARILLISGASSEQNQVFLAHEPPLSESAPIDKMIAVARERREAMVPPPAGIEIWVGGGNTSPGNWNYDDVMRARWQTLEALSRGLDVPVEQIKTRWLEGMTTVLSYAINPATKEEKIQETAF